MAMKFGRWIKKDGLTFRYYKEEYSNPLSSFNGTKLFRVQFKPDNPIRVSITADLYGHDPNDRYGLAELILPKITEVVINIFKGVTDTYNLTGMETVSTDAERLPLCFNVDSLLHGLERNPNNEQLIISAISKYYGTKSGYIYKAPKEVAEELNNGSYDGYLSLTYNRLKRAGRLIEVD